MHTFSIFPVGLLICPLDSHVLSVVDDVLKCSNGHCFDIAKQGYVNLLPVQNKRSSDPGDSKEMVSARQSFLRAGYYESISFNLLRILRQLNVDNTYVVLDAGCGEGYYLAKIQHEFSNLCIGLDISKWAVLAAAKHFKTCSWLVASNRDIPLLATSIDLIVCMFGFPCFDVFSKVLKAQGIVVLIDPLDDHLVELREVLYPQVTKHGLSNIDHALECGFELGETFEYRDTISVKSGLDIQNLLKMTPHLYKATFEGKQKALELSSIKLTLHYAVRVLQK